MPRHQRAPVLFPHAQKNLKQLGENLQQAFRRRRISQATIQSRTGLSQPTLRRIFKGEPTVAIGYYIMLLSMIRQDGEIAEVGRDEVFASKIAKIEAMNAEAVESSKPERSVGN